MGPSPQPPPASPGRLAVWVRQGVESFVAAQRILLDLTAQQNALALGMLRERVVLPSVQPVASLIRIASQGLEGLAGAGNILLDLAAGETTLAFEGAKEIMQLGPGGGALADVIRDRTVTLIEMQRRLLEGVAEQMRMVSESYSDGKGLTGGASIGELTRRAMEGFVATEKKFLNMVAEQITAAVEGTNVTRRTARSRSKVLTQLAREAVEKYIDAQRKLLELAIQQLDIEARTGKERAEAARTAAELRSSFAELTGKTVKNFVNAEKSLLDVAMRPIRQAQQPDGAPKTARKAPRKNTAAKRATA